MVGYNVFFHDGSWYFQLLIAVGTAAAISAKGYGSKCEARQAATHLLSIIGK